MLTASFMIKSVGLLELGESSTAAAAAVAVAATVVALVLWWAIHGPSCWKNRSDREPFTAC